jgi:hypothetical protein
LAHESCIHLGRGLLIVLGLVVVQGFKVGGEFGMAQAHGSQLSF